MDTTLQQAIQEQLVKGQLPCAQAMLIAKRLDLTPSKVGAASNDADIRISICQLGLFGYGPKAEGKHKVMTPMAAVPEELARCIRAAATGSGIRCEEVWEIAAALNIGRIQASSAVEALGLRVSHCQLGCFPRPK